MSDNWLRYVPKDPLFQPDRAMAETAKTLLAKLLQDPEEVDVFFFDRVTFIDPGSNWSGANCPTCGKDASAWWGDAMEEFEERGELEVSAPCCGTKVSLNELKYKWPCGYASFVIEAMNPNVPSLGAESIAQIERVLGCAVREIPQHL